MQRVLHGLYTRLVLPRLGAVVTREAAAYAYLHASVAALSEAHELAMHLRRMGLTQVAVTTHGLGAVALAWCVVGNDTAELAAEATASPLPPG